MFLHDRLTARDAALLVVDLQEKLLAPMKYRDLLVANAVRLLEAAQRLHIPSYATEQYPAGLGSSVAEIAERLPRRPAKTTFHCCAVGEILEQIHARAIKHVTLVGVEAHVCVSQTALELLKMGLAVQIPADAVGSRSKIDWEWALRRLERAGAIVSTTEAVLFEWIETADHPEFKAVSALVKNFVPPRKRKHPHDDDDQ